MTTKALSKQQLVEEIARRLGMAAPPMSTGSTEPRLIFEMVNDGLGLGLNSELTKPELAQAIAEAAGFPWLADFESRGGTVTRKGLAQVLRAVGLFLGDNT